MSLQSLIASGSKLWLDSVDPELVQLNRARGVTGATSNPVLIADLLKTGHFDSLICRFGNRGLENAAIAWEMNDELVRRAQEVFHPVWLQSGGEDGYVSFELDPLLEDAAAGLSQEQRVRRYIELGRNWAEGHDNRLIKVPATAAGLEALEELAAAGVNLNVTLMFTPRQCLLAREAIWRGARRRKDLSRFKSVYSVFLSRVDVWTEKNVPGLSPAAQGQVAIAIARRCWRENQAFWADKNTPLRQEMIFASTGVKKKTDPPDKYVEALAGADIQTNPPETLEAVENSGKTYTRRVDQAESPALLEEVRRAVDLERLEEALLAEGVRKFVEPQRALEARVAEKRAVLCGS